MIKLIIRKLISLPFYPHWLELFKRERGDNYILKDLNGKVIEVGAGDGSRKHKLINKYKKIKEYISTDHSSWDLEFERRSLKSKEFWGLYADFFQIKKRSPLDNQCSALKLPYKDNTFDYHLSFEVLEHIDDPYKFFKEASRILRTGGCIVMSVPFLYRMHGGEPNHYLDYFRYTYGFFYKVSKMNNLRLVKFYSNTGFGTTFASLTNQWIIQCIINSTIFIKIPLLICSPLIFFLTNTLGLLIDLKPNISFATRFHIVLQKK